MISTFQTMLDHIFKKLALLRPDPTRPLDSLNRVEDSQIGFGPPDEDWNSHVTGLDVSALNIYLVDIRENRKLRSNERNRVISESVVMEALAPRRIDCHYLITAWSPVTATPSTDPSLDEAALLYEVTRVLMHNDPLNPSRIYPAGDPSLDDWPASVRDCDIPTQVLPVEGFPKLAEFWGTMGEGHRWKPAVYLIATLPVLEPEFVAGPPVTTRIAEYRRAGGRGRGEVRAAIGGRVLDGFVTPPAPVAGAWVRLEKVDSTGASTPIATARSDALGQFRFERLPLGRYQLQWRARGYPDRVPCIVDIPSPTGEYDLIFE